MPSSDCQTPSSTTPMLAESGGRVNQQHAGARVKWEQKRTQDGLVSGSRASSLLLGGVVFRAIDCHNRRERRLGLRQCLTPMLWSAGSHRRWIAVALGCAALVFMLELAGPPAGHAQTGSRNRGLSELWRTYPLDPTTGDSRLRSGNRADQLPVLLPGSAGAPAESTGPGGGRPSAIGSGSSAFPAFPVLALSLVGLIFIVLVARFGSVVVAPIRSLASTPRPRHGFQVRTGAGAGLGRTVGRATRLPLHLGTLAGAGLRSAAFVLYSKRGEILLYAVVVVASVAVGIGVTLFLSGG